MSRFLLARTDLFSRIKFPCLAARFRFETMTLLCAVSLASGCMGLSPAAVPDVQPVDYEMAAHTPAEALLTPVVQPEPQPEMPEPVASAPVPVMTSAPEPAERVPAAQEPHPVGVIPPPTAQQIATPPLAAKAPQRASSAQEQRIAALELSLLNMSNELAWLKSQPVHTTTPWGTPSPRVVPEGGAAQQTQVPPTGASGQSHQDRIATLEQNMKAINNELLVLRGPVHPAPAPVVAQSLPVAPAAQVVPVAQAQSQPVQIASHAVSVTPAVSGPHVASVPPPSPAAVATPPLRQGTRPQALPDQVIPVPGSRPAGAASTKQGGTYQNALSAYESRRYAEALSGFDKYLADNPQGKLAPNAIYWKGEVRYAQNDYASAILLFRDVVTRFPKHAKAPDALLKIIMSYDRLKDRDNASLYLRILNEDYPNSSATKRANSLGLS